jgi:hypothetical protein
MGFTAPKQEPNKRLKTWYIFLTDTGMGKPLGEALAGMPLYSYEEDGKEVRMIAAMLDAPGCCKVYDPEVG